MRKRNQMIAEMAEIAAEYIGLNEAIDRNELRVERLLAELRDLDEESSRFADRQMVITSHLAPLFEDEDHVVEVFRGGESFAVSHEGDAFLTVRPLRNLASLVKADVPETISLPGRQATIYRGVAVVDQEVG